MKSGNKPWLTKEILKSIKKKKKKKNNKKKNKKKKKKKKKKKMLLTGNLFEPKISTPKKFTT